ncbi:Hypothetical protein PBC10988_1760 [Planctomycetales bacterium 10988]|nr:Hypothetical protein PBC10988_1760 [Planctomycetales bacterium 10988]
MTIRFQPFGDRVLKTFRVSFAPRMAFLVAVCAMALFSLTSESLAAEGSEEPTSVYGEEIVIDSIAQDSIDRGFEWLMAGLRKDGTIGTEANPSFKPDLASTAIVGLALLADGNTPTQGRYSQQTDKLLYGLLRLVDQRLDESYAFGKTALVQRKIGRNADLFLALLFLTEVYYETPYDEEMLRETIERLIHHICLTQKEDGTWGSESWAPILGTVIGWESLRTSASAGFRIDASAKKVAETLMENLERKRGLEESWMFRLYNDAASVRVLYSFSKYRESPLLMDTLEHLFEIIRNDPRIFDLAGGEEYYSLALVTECLVHDPRPQFKFWYPTVSRKLVVRQNRDGSWSGHHCIVDRTFCTAAALLTLMGPNQFLSKSDL